MFEILEYLTGINENISSIYYRNLINVIFHNSLEAVLTCVKFYFDKSIFN